MAQKIIVKIDISQIDKNKVILNEYTKRDGTVVRERNYSVDVVPLKEQQVIKTLQNGSQLVKTHFVAESQTKEERVQKAPTKYVGSGVQFITGASSADDAYDQL